MKEYWVNVYPNLPILASVWPKKEEAIAIAKIMYYNKLNYRLHVREFETKEAKELYLKLKCGNSNFYPYQIAALNKINDNTKITLIKGIGK